MRAFHTRYACAALIFIMTFANAAYAAEIVIGNAKSEPESLTMAPGGVLDCRQFQFAFRL